MMKFYYPKTARPCGVEDFTRNLERTLEAYPAPEKPCVVLSFPFVAWKKVFFAPLFALLIALFKGHSRLVILHEWKDLDWKRRWFIGPNLLLASHILFSSPYVQRMFEAGALARFTSKKRGCVPIPPSLERELPLTSTKLSEKIVALKGQGKFIIGHFGSIYARKQSLMVLDIAAQLKAKGKDVYVVFMGSFVKSGDNVEGLFNTKLHEFGLTQEVCVTGFLDTSEDLFALAEQIDCFIYTFEEGLTARRSSVLAVAQSGKPLIVPAPERQDEFAHHALYTQLIAAKNIQFVPLKSPISAYVEALMQVEPVAALEINYEAAWVAAALAVQDFMAHRHSRVA